MTKITPREREILALLADGHSAKDVAFRLNISPKTVNTHRYNLMRTLDIHNIVELVRYAIQHNITPPYQSQPGELYL